MGDLNISPTDKDIGIGENNMKRWLKWVNVHFTGKSEMVSNAYGLGINRYLPRPTSLKSKTNFLGLIIAQRLFDNRGLRIDFTASKSLLSR